MPVRDAAPEPSSARTPSRINQPAATVMFQKDAPPAEPARPSIERADTEPRNASLIVQREEAEPEQLTDQVARPTPSKLKAKAKTPPKKGSKGAAMPGWRTGGEAPAASGKKGSNKKIMLVAVSAVLLSAIIIVAALALRPKPEIESETVESQKPAAEPAAEPTPGGESAGLAAKPAPTPTAAPPPTTTADKAEKKPVAEKVVHAEKAKVGETESSGEKSKTGVAEVAEKRETRGKQANEDDLRRAGEAYQRGNTKMFQGKTAEAIAEFNQALALNPSDPSIHRGLGLAYAQSGQSQEAAKHLRLYLKASPRANDRAVIQKRIKELK